MRQYLKQSLGAWGLLETVRIWRRKMKSILPAQIAKRRRALIRQKEWVDFYAQFIQDGDLCFDVGANVGDRTEVFRKLGAVVVAVEPHHWCVQRLTRRFKNSDRVHIVAKGLGNEIGQQDFMISSDLQTSSMSLEWIASVKNRLSNYSWDVVQQVEITVLDALIETYGQPAFCKIDVEGFELQVLQGLSRPIKSVSFEYTPERLQPAMDCLHYLASLGKYAFNYSSSDTKKLALSNWVFLEEMQEILEQLRYRTDSGDVYARLLDADQVN